MNRAAIILAAGQGTRMKSALPKFIPCIGKRLAAATDCTPGTDNTAS